MRKDWLTCKYRSDGQTSYTSYSTCETRPITHHIDCNSKNVIYVAQCNHCFKQYIGETKRRLKDRFNEHRRLIDIVCETLKKEGHASRNIGNKKNLFPYVKSALLLLFNISSYSWLDPLFGSTPTFFCKLVLASKIEKRCPFWAESRRISHQKGVPPRLILCIIKQAVILGSW